MARVSDAIALDAADKVHSLNKTQGATGSRVISHSWAVAFCLEAFLCDGAG